MNKHEFLTQLEEQLRGFVSNQEVRESVLYYQSYIEEEMRKGRTEEEIFEDIGSANSVAKAIIEARGYDPDREEVYEEQEHYEEQETSGPSVKLFKTDGWKGMAILLGIILALILILSFAFRVVMMLIPYAVPILLIIFLIKMVTGRR